MFGLFFRDVYLIVIFKKYFQVINMQLGLRISGLRKEGLILNWRINNEREGVNLKVSLQKEKWKFIYNYF